MKLIIGEDGAATLFGLDQGGQPVQGTKRSERIEIDFPSVGGNSLAAWSDRIGSTASGCRTAGTIRVRWTEARSRLSALP